MFLPLQKLNLVMIYFLQSKNASDNESLHVDCPMLPKIIRPTDMIYFSDGKLKGEVIDVEEDNVKVRMKEGMEVRRALCFLQA